MKTRSNKSFGFVMVLDVTPGNWFRAGANQLFFRTEQENDEHEILCVDEFGKIKYFKRVEHVMATSGTYVEDGAQDENVHG